MQADGDSARVRRRGFGFAETGGRFAWRAGARDLLAGFVIVAALWMTIVPGDATGRMLQLSLGTFAVVALVFSVCWPVLTAGCTAAATGTAWVLGVTADPFLMTGLCVFVLAERRGSRRFPWWLSIGAAVILIAMLGFSSEGVEDRFRGLLLGAVVVAGAWVLGVRTRQTRYEASARSRAEERLRLGRDVHDVLSHSLGAIGVRAGVAAHVSTFGEAQLRSELRDIERSARESLTELRELLERERVDDASAGAVPPSMTLTAVLSGIVEAAERAGLRTQLEVPADVNELPAATRTTVLRVVQEAVTNTIRHASASSLSIAVQVSEKSVGMVVRDDGRGTPAGLREGHGLRGMRERLALVGGSLRLEANPRGFTVVARIPVTAAANSVPGVS